MSFNERLKNYRYNELQIKSKEAAAILGLEPAHYSHYETGRNRFPIDLLPLLKEKFMMSDDVFLEILLQRPRKRQTVKEMAVRLRKLQEAYLTKFGEDYFDLLTNADVRTLLATLNHPDEDVLQLRIKELQLFTENSPLFKNTSNVRKSIRETTKRVRPLHYKLNKQPIFVLIDGEQLQRLFLKTDDIPMNEE